MRARFLRPRDMDGLIETARKISVDYNKKYEGGLGQLGFMFDEYNISQTALAIGRLHMSSHFTGDMILEYDRLIKFTNDMVDKIIENREIRNRLVSNEFLKFPGDAPKVLASLCKLYKVKRAGVDVEDVIDDIGYLVDYKAIKKSIDAWYDDGTIYSIEPYKQMKLTEGENMEF